MPFTVRFINEKAGGGTEEKGNEVFMSPNNRKGKRSQISTKNVVIENTLF